MPAMGWSTWSSACRSNCSCWPARLASTTSACTGDACRPAGQLSGTVVRICDLVTYLPGLGIAGDIDRSRVGRGGSSGGVDDVLDHADPAEGHGEEVVELHAWCVRCLEGVVCHHRRVDVEVAVAAHPVGLMAGDAGCHLVGGVPIG